ncbi:MAG: hypothetical protein KBC95_00930 [Candidatus Peribacteraceae bacterium]|nr:hypothetical protein [Candidatus Peribacteraceae bacterium]
MSKDLVRTTLAEFGLEEKEIALYLLLLQLGPSAASTLAPRAGIPRSTAQFTCQQLVKRGLLTMARKANVYLFAAEPPETLAILLRRQRTELEEQEYRLERIIGELKAMQNPFSVLPKVQFFEGRDGIIAAYETVLRDLTEGGEIIGYLKPLSLEGDEFRLAATLDSFVERRVAREVATRILCPRGAAYASDAAKLRQVRSIPGELFTFDAAEVMIYASKMYSMTVERGQIFAFIVENASIVQLQRAVFEHAWAHAESAV